MAMTITIDQAEITTALAKHVRDLMPALPDDIVITADLSATRGPAGYTADIKLLTPEQAEEIEKAERAAAREAKKADTAPEKPKVTRVRTSGNKSLGIAAKVAEAKAETVNEKVPEPESEAQVEEAANAEVEAQQDEEEIARQLDAQHAPFAEDENEVVEEQEENLPSNPPAEAEVLGGEPEEPAAPRKSLFGGLSKPVN